MSNIIKLRKLRNRQIFHGDNLQVMGTLDPEQLDFIYIDPPYCSDSVYISKAWGKQVGFDDTKDIDDYCDWIEPRLEVCHKLLNKNGVFCIQLDIHAIHRVKLILDEIFLKRGGGTLINKIIWQRYSGQKNNLKRKFANDCDFILCYSKGKNYTFNQLKKSDLSPEYIKKEYRYAFYKGEYIKLTKAQLEGKEIILGDRCRSNRRSKNSKQEKGTGSRYTFLKNSKGIQYNNIWTDITECTNNEKETTGFPTQKPEPLLERLLKTFTKENDFIADFFCGCGTTIRVAEKLDLNWIGLDIYYGAIEVMQRKIEENHSLKIEIVKTMLDDAQSLDKLHWLEYQIRTIELIGGKPNFDRGKDGGVDGWLFEDIPIQVKCHSNPVSAKELELKFIKIIRKSRRKVGYFIAKNGFTNDFEKQIRSLKKDGITIVILDTQGVVDIHLGKRKIRQV